MSAPRCPDCCQHGVPWAHSHCGWCDEIAFSQTANVVQFGPDEPMMPCPHGIGGDA